MRIGKRTRWTLKQSGKGTGGDSQGSKVDRGRHTEHHRGAEQCD